MTFKIEHMLLSEPVYIINVTQINSDLKLILRYTNKGMMSKIPQDIGIWKIKYKPKK